MLICTEAEPQPCVLSTCISFPLLGRRHRRLFPARCAHFYRGDSFRPKKLPRPWGTPDPGVLAGPGGCLPALEGLRRARAAPGAALSPRRLCKCLVSPHLSSAAALPASPGHFYRSGDHVFPSPLRARYFHISSVIIRLFKRGKKKRDGGKKRGDSVARWLEAVLKLPALKNLSAKFRPIVSGFPLIPCCN